jgi:hypothetical protein
MPSRIVSFGVASLLVTFGCGSRSTHDAAGGTGGADASGGGGGMANDASDVGPGGGGGPGGSGVRDAGEPINVKGTIYNKYDVPFPAVNVRIGSTVTQTAADGSFEIDGVSLPYDLDVWTTTTSQGTVVAHYAGLTRPDPAAHLFIYIPPPHRSTIDVTFPAPLPSDEVANCQFANPARSVRMGAGNGSAPGGASTFSMQVSWYTDGTSISGTLSCLTYKQGTLDPTRYGSFASAPVTLTDAATASVNLALTPVTAGTLTVHVADGGATNVRVSGDLLIAGGTVHPITSPSGGPTNPVALVIPQISGATVHLIANGGTPNGQVYSERGGSPTAGSVDMTLPPPIILTSPADDATMVDTATALSWSAPAGTVVFLQLSTLAAGAADYNIYAAQGAVTIPDLAAQGVPLPSGAVYDWTLYSLNLAASVDTVASPGYPCVAIDLLGDCDDVATNARSFTTQ